MHETHTIPQNVPAELVVDFNFYNPPGAQDDVQLAWARLHDGPDIVWTPHNGGHWIATRAEDIDVMQLDHEHFSHANYTIPRGDYDAKTLPLSLDPPAHGPFRKLINPGFNFQAVKALEDVARRTARELIDRIEPAGECEFISQFAHILPVNVFLTLVDVPVSDGARLVPLADAAVRSGTVEAKTNAHAAVEQYLLGYLRDRTENPGTDMLSQIATAKIDGRPISEDEKLAVAVLVMLGGLDTVASQLGFIANHLARNPDHRRQLVETPGLIPRAIEEFLRRFAIVNTARVLAMDYDYKGIHFREGDMIQLPKSLHGLDDRLHEHPEKIDFTRKPSSIKLAAFGAGPHVCPGAMLARREIAVFLEEWLQRIPDFSLAPDKPPVFVSGGVNSVERLYLTW